MRGDSRLSPILITGIVGLVLAVAFVIFLRALVPKGGNDSAHSPNTFSTYKVKLVSTSVNIGRVASPAAQLEGKVMKLTPLNTNNASA
jgi:hypothetical protein